ncbi:MFS general substrate transporter [Linnemannia elongata AG-77]|uniref:MFS general substrate transporter n=1 Tax=Linnemannia elongata AG-77 TaxID=1314771 RepID=A0A197K830_9FUNG|nr:MFS general substrate transporter [Linnemannia elongata AG-77]
MPTAAMRQIILIGVICFGTIGMFNAMSSIGNAGKHSSTAQNLAITSSSIAYIVGFLVAGGAHNMIGPRLCVAFGGFTFFLYAGAMFMAKDDDRSLYPPIAGILLGLGAGCIWVTQGAMMMSYPTEDNKGKYIACFWAIYNLGAVLGSVLPLTVFLATKGPDQDDVAPETYIVYMVIMGLATLLGFFLSKPSSIVRDNGDPVVVAKFESLKAETLAILSVFCDWRMLLLIPAFFFSNFSYTYQFNDFNGYPFNIGARSLNSAVFWIAQIIGAIVIGYMLDGIPVKRPRRAIIGLFFIGVLFMATWLAALMMQIQHKWDRKPFSGPQGLISFNKSEKYTALVAIYGMFGFCDAAFAVYCYWLMGALSNKHDELSRYAGFFKSIQSLGGAVAAPLDLARTPLLAYLVTNWVLCALSIAAMFLVARTITDTTIEDGEYQEEEYDYDDATESYMTDDRSSHHHHHREEQHEMSSTANVAGQATGAAIAAAAASGAQDLRPRDMAMRSSDGDQSTLCAVSDNGKRISDSRSIGHPSSSWRSSSRTSGLQDGGGYPDHELRHLGGNNGHHGSHGGVSSNGHSGMDSALSYSSAVDPMAIPSRTYQTTAFLHNPTAMVDPYISPALRYSPPPMSEVQQQGARTLWVEQPYPGGAGAGAGGMSRSTSIHSLYPGFQPSLSSPSGSSNAPLASSSSYSPGLLPPSSWSPHSHNNSTLPYSYGAPPSPVPPAAIATATASGSLGHGMFVPPTFMISDESSPSIPLYTFHPGSNFQNDSDMYLPGDLPHLGAHTPPPPAAPGVPVGPIGGEGYLQPFMPFDPMLGQQQQPHHRAAGSATSSTSRYDDDQEMDSIDTHSISSSMSSGHDSIPEMTEMSDTLSRHAHDDSDED